METTLGSNNGPGLTGGSPADATQDLHTTKNSKSDWVIRNQDNARFLVPDGQ